ncbi:Membrane associated serine protease, rhomboid family [Frankineae bacterium MT45]|nr:Membrane associated serine protease, rhomboid family [Frankineae bacterium MT45]
MNWARALLLMTIAAGVLWVIEFVNWMLDQRLDRFGLRPRELSGLEGVVTMPFLHPGFWPLLSNTPAFIVLGWAVLISGMRIWTISTGLIVVIGGLLTWFVAPSGLIIGVSSLIFGWLGYLLARAFFSRRILWILGAVVAAFMFSGLFAGLIPSVNSNTSWQAHLCGFLAGVFVGWLLHPRQRRGGAMPPAKQRSKNQRASTQPSSSSEPPSKTRPSSASDPQPSAGSAEGTAPAAAP